MAPPPSPPPRSEANPRKWGNQPAPGSTWTEPVATPGSDQKIDWAPFQKEYGDIVKIVDGKSLETIVQELQREEMKPSDFSFDVVFSLENLARGLGIQYLHRDLVQASVEERLGIGR